MPTSYVIERDGEIERVASLDGCEGCTVVQELADEPPHDFFKVIDGAWAEDPDTAPAEAWALNKVAAEADGARTGELPQTMQIAVVLLWHEIQRLKLAQAVNQIPADLTERRKQYPTLMALVALTGNTLAQVATAAENRFWDRMRRMALWTAKEMLARDAVRAAGTTGGKVAAADVSWSE